MDWLAGLFELFGLWAIGNRNRIGFISNIIGCSIWIYVAFDKEVYGLLLVVITAIILNIKGFINWK